MILAPVNTECSISTLPNSIQLEESSRFRPRALLTELQAIEIYKLRKAKQKCVVRTVDNARITVSAADLAKKFNVSPKTIRDIWNRRTWTQETRHLWTEDERPLVRFKCPKQQKCRLNAGSSNYDSNSSDATIPSPTNPDRAKPCSDRD